MAETKKVVNFGKIKTSLDLPNLIEIQIKSYDWFLQSNVPRKKMQGLQDVFKKCQI